jgi:hypothetical protein
MLLPPSALGKDRSAYFGSVRSKVVSVNGGGGWKWKEKRSGGRLIYVVVCFCCVITFKSNVGLCISVYASFVCSFCVLSL